MPAGGVVPLTAAPQSAVDGLLNAGKIAQVNATGPARGVDVSKAARFLDNAATSLVALTTLSAPPGMIFDVAHNACHDAGEAMLAAYGYRTASGPGAHVTVGRFLEAIFDQPPAQTAARAFDTLRAARNGLRYEAKNPTSTHLSAALYAARTLVPAAAARLA